MQITNKKKGKKKKMKQEKGKDFNKEVQRVSFLFATMKLSEI